MPGSPQIACMLCSNVKGLSFWRECEHLHSIQEGHMKVGAGAGECPNYKSCYCICGSGMCGFDLQVPAIGAGGEGGPRSRQKAALAQIKASAIYTAGS